MRADAVLFYAEKFLAGTMFLTNEQTGKYIRALCAQQLHGHLSPEKISVIVESDKDVMSKFEKDEDGFYNQRMDDEVMRAKKYLSKKAKRKRGTESTDDPDFDAFWQAYPRKVGKQKAFESWQRIKQSDRADILEKILKALVWQCESEQWIKHDGQYIPHPVTYLNQHRWEDQPVSIKKKSLSEQYRQRYSQ